MANLIPPQARGEVKREYWMRVGSVWLVLVGTAFIMVALLQWPTHVLVGGQIDAFDQQYQEVSNSNEQFKESVAVITRTNEISRVLNSEIDHVDFTTYIDELNAQKTEEIAIADIVMNRTEGVVESIVVSGDADTRNALSNFRIALESSDLFVSAALPLSNLAKDSDIPFRITITLTEETDV